MISRRNFLFSSGVLSASATGLCASPNKAELARRNNYLTDLKAEEYLFARERWLTDGNANRFLGYPLNLNFPSESFFKWREELYKTKLGILPGNNVGDPFSGKGIDNSSHDLESDLVRRFASRFGFSSTNAWGFVSNSGTDSNMHGAYMGRSLLKNRTGILPKVYYTKDSHYSIQIIRDLLGLEEVLVEPNSDGSMNIDDLELKLLENKMAPVLLIATLGTTFKGGIDDIDAINSKLSGVDSYVHLDAALFGGYLQALPFSTHMQHITQGKVRYDSIAVSFHKFFGYPSVAGLFITGRTTFESFRDVFAAVHDPAYISHVPGTITCSRDPVKPAELHYFTHKESLLQQRREARMVLDNADYLHSEMRSHFSDLKPRRADEHSNIVYFNNEISSELATKWNLATMAESVIHGRSMAHVVVMPHVNKSLLDDFLTDLEKDLKPA
ncbi:MAG: pyridoxal-dependent decarboxylase [Halieaceae bacterium]|nr:pyridoxal-dependent decarboxylase [Halieaceae bacterium]